MDDEMMIPDEEEDDSFEDIDWLCNKISKMRLFSDDEGKMNRSLVDSSVASPCMQR